MIDGLCYYENVIDDELEEKILDFLNDKNNNWFKVRKNNAKSRMVLHYGYEYNYKTRKVKTKADPMPKIIVDLLSKVGQYGIDHTCFNQCIINRYLCGQGIGKHIDHLSYGPIICCFSVGSNGQLVFSKGGEKDVKFIVKKKSLYIMEKDARYKWKHEMPKDKTYYDKNDKKLHKVGTRYSITFRQV